MASLPFNMTVHPVHAINDPTAHVVPNDCSVVVISSTHVGGGGAGFDEVQKSCRRRGTCPTPTFVSVKPWGGGADLRFSLSRVWLVIHKDAPPESDTETGCESCGLRSGRALRCAPAPPSAPSTCTSNRRPPNDGPKPMHLVALWCTYSLYFPKGG